MTAAIITKALGGRWCGTYGLARCPAHDDREPSLSIRDGEHELIVNCFAGCAWQDVKAELKRQGLIDDWSAGVDRRGQHARRQAPAAAAAATTAADDLEQRIAIAMGTWTASISLLGTLGGRYFIERRGLYVGLLDNLGHCLRFHGGVNAVVALMTDPITNEATGVHRTFLAPGVKRQRKMLGRRGAIRLSRDEDVLEGLGICEGIETGLRILLNGWSPIWCAGDAGGIKRFPVLSGVKSLTIFTEDDENNTNINAAHDCAERWVAADREVRLADPKDALNGL
jgi:putative DNA primase/helicase